MFERWPTRRRHGSVCEIAAGLQGRIENIFASSGAAPRLQVERGGRLYPAKAGCFLLAGDIVRTRPGVTAVISLPEGGSAQADFDHPLVVPNMNRPNYLQSVIEVLREIVGANGEKARSPVTGQVEMRAADDDEPGPLLIPGISGVDGLGRQSVVREAPLVIRWSGGASPFRVRLVWGEGDQFVDLKGGPERFARMDVHNARSGPAEVRILSSDGKETRIGINLASKANRPLELKRPRSLWTRDSQPCRGFLAFDKWGRPMASRSAVGASGLGSRS